MRRAVRDQVRSGADFIKIMACHDTLEFTDEELAAVVDESHRNNMPITAHATFDAAISRMADFEVDIIEHGGNMSADTINRLVDRNIPIVTTFAPIVMQSKPEIARRFNIPEWKIKERQAAVADKGRYDSLVRASKAGVRIVFGTDAGSPAVGHDVIVPELEFMVSLGVVEDNTAALRSITSVAADVHGVGETVGTLVTGKEADIVVVDGNPIENLKALANVKMTFVKGQRLI
jgi:imidazolonepropionase-like amidohydrolase